MARGKRIISLSGIYHVMVRGINQQRIFNDEEDNLTFLEILKEFRVALDYQVFAYCLMVNHAHILIKIPSNMVIGDIMKRIGTKYVQWYNRKYYRCGHLFQDRFKSEPVETDECLFSVLRYIHQNPVKSSIVNSLFYKYSSYREYINGGVFADVDIILNMIDMDEFIEFHKCENEDAFLENESSDFRLNDADVMKIILRMSKCRNVEDFIKLDKDVKIKFVKKLKKKGLPIKQISRLTGISYIRVRDI